MVADPGIVQVIGILLNHSVNIVGILSHLLLLSILIIWLQESIVVVIIFIIFVRLCGSWILPFGVKFLCGSDRWLNAKHGRASQFGRHGYRVPVVHLLQLLVIELSGRFIHERSWPAFVSVEQLGDIVVANRELGLKLVGVVPSGGVLARLME